MKLPRRAQAGAGGDIGHGRDFDIALLELEHPQHLADDRVLHLARLRDSFDMGIANDDLVDECPVDRDVDGLVDGRRDQEPAELPVVGRQIRPAASRD